jgi:selenide, water dikinase
VDDPATFGRIAAANALSDVYAMGGLPLTALSIAAFPEKDFPLDWAAAIVRGGAEALREADCVLLGGHTVRDPEIKFGYAVTGLVDPERILTNAGARPGDVLVLTKALGTGVIATALKAGAAPPDVVETSARSMATLNRAAAAAALRHGVRGATDITGFGLAGHAAAIARESGVTLEIRTGDLPLLPGAAPLARDYQPGGLRANRKAFQPLVLDRSRAEESVVTLFYDPQTSGGLLLALPERSASALLAEVQPSWVIGRAVPAGVSPLVLL